MENEIIDELTVLVPSECVRSYVLETGWVFTDEQKAVLLVYGGLPLKEQHSRLQALQKNIDDQSLQERIAKYLNKEELKFQAFKDNSDKAYIYILKVKDEDIPYLRIQPTEYFFALDQAYECGRETNLPFMIEKYLVEAPGITGQYDPETTFLEFNKNSEWHRKHWDFSDVQIRIEFLCEDGSFSHDHVNPINLERYCPEEDWDRGSPMDELLLHANLVHRGKVPGMS